MRVRCKRAAFQNQGGELAAGSPAFRESHLLFELYDTKYAG
jgi:hypothetical protein